MTRVRVFVDTARVSIPLYAAEHIITDFGEKAKKFKSKADHLVYAAKYFETDGKLDYIRCYNPPREFTDEDFKSRCTGCKSMQVYAIHKR